MKTPTKKRIALILTGVTVFLFSYVGYKVYEVFARYPHESLTADASPVELVVPRGTSFTGIVNLLKKKGLINKPLYFRMYTLFSRGDVSVQSGHYNLKKSDTPAQILKTLLKGPVVHMFRVTIPEGKHILQVADILAQAGVGKKDDIIKGMYDKTLLREFSIPFDNLEGYLFPETYRFRKGTSIRQVLRTMVKQYKKIWNHLKKTNQKQFRGLTSRLGFDSDKILIMASLVEKETGVKRERPLIAGVFLNRLEFKDFKPKLLQTDPTIIYGCTVPLVKSTACNSFQGRIRRIHLRDKENPYNTYTVTGLTPGPICSPGAAALKAVLNPTKSKYLYFVAKSPGGEHYFSKSVKEHEAAVRRYILKQ
ncbi:endolytic transglycosylase MltG [Myxococcota bacterium]|nr:endolytic transglycosylase MltG [Myxococcota bacterium]MBU1533691.1 endolytic transglycosylase MltG [Myxococcota bacterium]